MHHLTLTCTLSVHCDSRAELIHAIRHGPAARKTASRSATTTPMSLQSIKMGERFTADSPLEAKVMVLADVLEDVVAYRPQAVEITHQVGSKGYRAFPDLALLQLSGEVELWEVKPERMSAAVSDRLEYLARSVGYHRIGYLVRTPAWFGQGFLYSNASTLHRLADWPVSPKLRRVIDASGPSTVGTLMALADVDVREVYGAAAQGFVALDIGSSPLGPLTPTRPSHPGATSGGFDGRNSAGTRA